MEVIKTLLAIVLFVSVLLFVVSFVLKMLVFKDIKCSNCKHWNKGHKRTLDKDCNHLNLSPWFFCTKDNGMNINSKNPDPNFYCEGFEEKEK